MLLFSRKLLSYRLLSKNLKIKIYKTTILPVMLYGCEIWPLTLREECSLRVFENRRHLSEERITSFNTIDPLSITSCDFWILI